MPTKIRHTKAALIGAVLGVIGVAAGHAMGTTSATNNSLAYWFGVALGGAVLGVAVAAIKNRGR